MENELQARILLRVRLESVRDGLNYVYSAYSLQ